MIRLRPSGADEVLIKRVRDWYEPGPGVFIAPQALFNPALLFTTGVSGAWYDPSDFSTLFQDAAGTLPVTAVEQPVGLMLDKSKGLVLGPELAPSLASSTGWNLSAKWVVSGGTASIDGTQVGTTYLQPSPSIYTPGKTIQITYTISAISGGSGFRAELATASGQPYVEPTLRTAPGTYTCRLSSTAGAQMYFGATAGCAVTITNISVRELPGNHAFNSSGNSANFPVLSARYNLYVNTETLATQNVTTVAASYKLTFTGSGSITLTGTATGVYTAGSYTISCTAGTLTSTVLGTVTQADLRVANDALNQPAYQRVNTSSDYDTVGFKPYLRFNGTNQWLQTNSIDFTYGDKAFVCAGLRKLSDAARGIVTELSASAAANAGSFSISAPNSASATYGAEVRGGASARSWTYSTYTSPITSVISASVDSAGSGNAQMSFRVNGTSNSGTGAGASTTGSLGNYPLYIGARAGSSLWFNGRLYGLVIAGKQASDSEITNTETFINQRTGAF